RTEDDGAAIRYQGTWTPLSNPALSGGSLRYASAAGSLASFTWQGTDARLIAAKGPRLGKLWVNLDGRALLVDLYSPTQQARQVVFARSDLPYGSHTLVLQPSGFKNPNASGTTVDLDAIDSR